MSKKGDKSSNNPKSSSMEGPIPSDQELEIIHSNLEKIPAKEDSTNSHLIELTRARDELQETRDKYIALYDFAPVGYATLDSQGIILEANLRLSEFLGLEKSKLPNTNFNQYLNTDSQEAFLNHLQSTLGTGSRQRCEIQLKKKNGAFLRVQLESIAIRDPRGRLSQCYSTITDITDRQRYESLQRYQSAIEGLSSDAIIATDKDLNITHWNQSATAIFGWQSEEVLGPRVPLAIRAQILEPLTSESVMHRLEENGSWKGEITLCRKDGSKFRAQVSLSILWDNTGNFNGVVAIHRENKTLPNSETSPLQTEVELKVKERTEELIKANRLLQQELTIHKQTALLAKESEGKNRDLVDNIKLGIFRSTPGLLGKFLEVNKAMEEITGYSREELLQIDVCKLFPGDAEQKFTNEISIADWKVTREMDLKRKDDSMITIAMTVVAIRFDSGTIQYIDGILEDITERKMAQQQVQYSLQRLQKTIKEIIEAMAYIGEVRDPYTAGHQRRVAQISFELAKILGLNDEQYEGLTMAAFVHDIGKILVPADILSKPGKLTKPEFDMLKDHTRIGYEILKTIEFPWPIAKIVLQHHERMDGSGYPSGLTGDQIIIEARILAVADVVEAMSSHRPYRPALGIDKALEEINLHSGILYDSTVVDACNKLFVEQGYSLN